jgi:hypothetical protein
MWYVAATSRTPPVPSAARAASHSISSMPWLPVRSTSSTVEYAVAQVGSAVRQLSGKYHRLADPVYTGLV